MGLLSFNRLRFALTKSANLSGDLRSDFTGGNARRTAEVTPSVYLNLPVPADYSAEANITGVRTMRYRL
jgi:hypothetical protein